MTNLQIAIASGQVSAAQIEAHRAAGDLNVTSQQAMPYLPDTSFLGEGISYGYDDGDMHAYAKKYAAQLTTELEAARAALQLTYVELHHCSQQLVASGWTKGSTVRNALNVARDALSNTKEQSND